MHVGTGCGIKVVVESSDHGVVPDQRIIPDINPALILETARC